MHRLLAESSIAGFSALLGAGTVKSAIDDVLREARAFSTSGEEDVPLYDVILARLQARLSREASRADLREVLNGTGILLHTNLGRAPLAQEAIDAMAEVSRGYCNLEYDLETGTRGSRYDKVVPLLRSLTGAEDALVVNNCAAAMLLILDTFARGREVIVARNQLIEIGGGFRLPDVLERSGARLVDVGTTNKVYLRDYERALTPNTGLILYVNQSNYRIEGDVEEVDPARLVALAHSAGVITVEDLGSGALVDLERYGVEGTRTAEEAVADGVDLVAFSGDKLVGGPQAGLVVGLTSLVGRMLPNPLLRALRVGKETIAAMEATLRLFNDDLIVRLPLYRMLSYDLESLKIRAAALAEAVDCAIGARVRVVDTSAFVGGGSFPGRPLRSAGIALTAEGIGAARAALQLRSSRRPVACRVENDEILLDMRTICPEDDTYLAASLSAAALAGHRGQH